MSLQEDFEASLEKVAEKCGDPTRIVYEKLYRDVPCVRAMFEDMRGNLKGPMINEALFALMGLSSGDSNTPYYLQSEQFTHEGYDVSASMFLSFFSTMRDVFKEALQDDWTPQFDAAWTQVLARASDLIDVKA